MKFIAPLGDTGLDNCGHISYIYGPYADANAADEALARMWPNDKTNKFLVFDGEIVGVKPSPKEKPESEKRDLGNMDNYVPVQDGDGYTCKDCGATVLAGKIAHPVWIKGFTGAGTGECKYETVPYCPNCDKKPNFSGAPVYVN